MDKKLRKRVSVLVVNNGKVLGFYAEDDHNKKDYFFLPGGKQENGESLEDTGRRETLEETGYSVSIQKEPRIFRKYDFEWQGQVYDCETWLLYGTLDNEKSIEVDDADYHKGVGWVSISDVDTVFNYHPEILAPIQEMLNSRGF